MTATDFGLILVTVLFVTQSKSKDKITSRRAQSVLKRPFFLFDSQFCL